MKKFLPGLFLWIIFNSCYGAKKKDLIFSFGNQPSYNDNHISSALDYHTYNYGFDFETQEKVNFENNSFTANEAVFFSVKVPEGNYQIKVVLGSTMNPSCTSIRAESRRLMLREQLVERGDSEIVVFTINIRSPTINSKEEINLKERELDDLNWDEKLTLEFSGEVAVKEIHILPAPNLKTIFLAGDSTVTDQDLEPWASWGQMITQYFNPGVVVANYAASGESLSSFKSRKRLKKILALIKRGDYLIIEFGHNDEKQNGKGMGPWLSYTNSLKEYIIKAREKNAIPILITPTQRRFFTKNGELENTHGEYPAAMRKVAKDLNVPLIDLTAMTTKMYESWGDEISRKAFVQYPAHTFRGQDKKLEDNTHFNSFGANEIALAILQGMRGSQFELKEYIRPEAPKYNPLKPNQPSTWTTPPGARFESNKPDGN